MNASSASHGGQPALPLDSAVLERRRTLLPYPQHQQLQARDFLGRGSSWSVRRKAFESGDRAAVLLLACYADIRSFLSSLGLSLPSCARWMVD